MKLTEGDMNLSVNPIFGEEMKKGCMTLQFQPKDNHLLPWDCENLKLFNSFSTLGVCELHARLWFWWFLMKFLSIGFLNMFMDEEVVVIYEAPNRCAIHISGMFKCNTFIV